MPSRLSSCRLPSHAREWIVRRGGAAPVSDCPSRTSRNAAPRSARARGSLKHSGVASTWVRGAIRRVRRGLCVTRKEPPQEVCHFSHLQPNRAEKAPISSLRRRPDDAAAPLLPGFAMHASAEKPSSSPRRGPVVLPSDTVAMSRVASSRVSICRPAPP